MIRRLRALREDVRGSTIVELAIVAPILATFVIGMTDFSRGYSLKLQVEQAAQRSIEKAMQGKKKLSLYQTLKAEAAAAADVAESAVTVKYWLECNGVSQNTSTATMDSDFENKVCGSGQTYARYVTVSIDKTFTPLFSTKWAGSNADGTYTINGKAGLRVQ
jgi:Flp pilus assembly protein TadG